MYVSVNDVCLMNGGKMKEIEWVNCRCYGLKTSLYTPFVSVLCSLIAFFFEQLLCVLGTCKLL